MYHLRGQSKRVLSAYLLNSTYSPFPFTNDIYNTSTSDKPAGKLRTCQATHHKMEQQL